MTKIMITTTISIPTYTPLLKISPINSQLLSNDTSSSIIGKNVNFFIYLLSIINHRREKSFDFFYLYFLKPYNMHYSKIMFTMLAGGMLWTSCQSGGNSQHADSTSDTAFQVTAESFADLQILRYQVPGWEKLDARQKEL